MKTILRTAAASALALLTISGTAQIKLQSPNGDLNFRLMGRTNLDLGTYLGADDNAPNRNGACINETRLGLIADFEQDWQAKIELSFSNGGVAFRDVYVQRRWLGGQRKLQIGNTFMPFGIKIMGLAYKFIETATTDLMFTPSRKLGAHYFVVRDRINLAVGIFTDGSSDAKLTNTGWQVAGQAKAHLIRNEDLGTVLDLGLGAVWTHPKNTVKYSANMPTTIHSNSLIATPAMETYNHNKLDAHALYINKRFYAEAHYMQAFVNTPDSVFSDNYKANGFFVQTSWLLKGDQQKYNPTTGLAANSAPKSLELLLRYNMTNLEEFGKVNDITLGMTYFISKYLNAKVNYVHSMVKDGANLDLIQGRMTFSF